MLTFENRVKFEVFFSQGQHDEAIDVKFGMKEYTLGRQI